MAKLKTLPQCTRCIGKHWIDLGEINAKTGEHLYQCGGGIAHTEANEMKNGCGRVIIAMPAEMEHGGEI